MALELIPLTLREAWEYVANFHRHCTASRGGKFAIGVSDGNGLVGVAIIGRPICRHHDDGMTVEVRRVCTQDNAPKNVCSMLYSAAWRAWRAMGGKKIITYTLQVESGTSIKAAGWKILGETKASPNGWSNNVRKREWQPIYGQTKFRWEMTVT
ncbi:hypothetical protein [uncultured Mediterranean phage uvDeep-CGR2-KM23-C246]|nr:hypothetical protein [uncultured Mediterranean phage uvDeep-CGR2-KM23-C246]